MSSAEQRAAIKQQIFSIWMQGDNKHPSSWCDVKTELFGMYRTLLAIQAEPDLLNEVNEAWEDANSRYERSVLSYREMVLG